MKTIFLLAAFIPFVLQAQDKGVHFQHELSWQQVQAKAKAEHKYIFMDCFTTWCGPCKFMTAQIFPQESVGDVLNKDFISIKVQLDTTANDNEQVKSWYKDGHDIAEQYKVRAYPTYLFFDPNGKLVHLAVGSSPAEDFIAKVKNAMNPETQYYSLMDKYKSGEKDSAFLRKVLLAAQGAYDMDNGREIFQAYLKTQPDLYTKSNLQFIRDFTSSTKDNGFAILYKDAAKVNAVLGAGVAESITQQIIMREEVYNKFPKSKDEKPDWTAIDKSLTKNYPALAPEMVAKAKVIWYQHVQDWEHYKTVVVDYMNKYGANASVSELNNYAWTVFQKCDDMACVSEALNWSKRSFKDSDNPMFIDTYANILYKLGKKDEAIVWEQKAIDLVPDAEKADYQKTIDKMKAGEKTWD
ncbi:MAG: thioredoxin fold domain-containing protein [Ferruginibacter sp.]